MLPFINEFKPHPELSVILQSTNLIRLIYEQKTLILAMVSLFIFGLVNFDLAGSNPILLENWVKLGSKKVNFKVDKDVITVGAQEGGFVSLKIVVTDGSLNMHRMIVHYGNGTNEPIELRNNFTKDSGSRIIDLKGKKRIITKIVFWYDTKNMTDNKANVTVFGKL
ncbi:MAG: hypothetical protein HC831_07165 [Chloroflexia bacterium]|nr:hypothetical protein [Chloroflexia bacterium]